MYAPVALRFQNYGIELSPSARVYQQKVLDSPSLQAWLEQASLEVDIVAEDEAGEDVSF